MPNPSDTPVEPPHDILAADEFAIGASDPALHQESPHDILAAEEFPMGAGGRGPSTGPAHDVLAAEEFPMPAPVRHVVPPDYAGDGVSRRRRSAAPYVAATLLIAAAITWRRVGRSRRARVPNAKLR